MSAVPCAASFPFLSKGIFKYFSHAKSINVLAGPQSKPNVLMFFPTTEMLEIAFVSQNEDDRKTATQIFQDDIRYYTENNEENWTNLLKLCGIIN